MYILLLALKTNYILSFSNSSPSFLFFQNVCFITPQFLYQFFCLFSQQVSLRHCQFYLSHLNIFCGFCGFAVLVFYVCIDFTEPLTHLKIAVQESYTA